MKPFSTKSLNIIAWLLYKGFEIAYITIHDEQQVCNFHGTDELYKVLEEYHNNRELKAFLASFKNVKQKIRAKAI